MKTKPKSEVWEHFLRKTVNGKVVYDCKYCSAQYTKHATRMSKHVATCLKAPSSLKNTSAKSAILRSKSRESLTEECKSTDNTIDQERAGKLTYVYHNIKLSNLHLKSSTIQVEVQEATGEKEEGNKDNEQEEIEFVGNEETDERGREDEEVESMSDEVVDCDVGSEEDDDDEEV